MTRLLLPAPAGAQDSSPGRQPGEPPSPHQKPRQGRKNACAHFYAILLLGLISADATSPANYQNDFQSADEASLPKELMIITGKFEVKKEADNKFLQLAGEPLESFGVMLGADEHTTICASIRATNTGKRFPEFGIALNGAGGYRLWLMPSVNEIQITKNEEPKVSKSYPWKAGSWLNLKLHSRKLGDKIILEGKAWPQGSPEPADWMITFEDPEKTPKGRPSIWGVPYSGTPIDFDNISISK